jgi:thiamine monophosphate kinase
MESNVKIEINEELLPIKHLLKFKVDNLKYLLNSGEEYALLFTIDPQFKDSIINEINNKLGRMPFHIGYVKNGSGSYLKKDNRLDDISRMGYVHRL